MPMIKLMSISTLKFYMFCHFLYLNNPEPQNRRLDSRFAPIWNPQIYNPFVYISHDLFRTVMCTYLKTNIMNDIPRIVMEIINQTSINSCPFSHSSSELTYVDCLDLTFRCQTSARQSFSRQRIGVSIFRLQCQKQMLRPRRF